MWLAGTETDARQATTVRVITDSHLAPLRPGVRAVLLEGLQDAIYAIYAQSASSSNAAALSTCPHVHAGRQILPVSFAVQIRL